METVDTLKEHSCPLLALNQRHDIALPFSPLYSSAWLLTWRKYLVASTISDSALASSQPCHAQRKGVVNSGMRFRCWSSNCG